MDVGERFRNLHKSSAFRGGITVLAVVLLAIGVVLAMAEAGLVSLTFIAQNWTFLLGPALTSVWVTVLSFLIGFTLAIPMGLTRAFAPRIIRERDRRVIALAPLYSVVTAYVEAIRGTPALVQIFLIANVASSIFQGNPNIPILAGILALTINTAGYQAEVFRAGFQSVGQSQIEAAKSIGMRPVQVFGHITLPQSLRLILLPLANEWIGLFKTSALLWLVAVQELTWAGSYLGNNRSHPIEAFLMISAVYLTIILLLSRVVNYLERTRRIPGLGVTERQVVRQPRVRQVPVPSGLSSRRGSGRSVS